MTGYTLIPTWSFYLHLESMKHRRGFTRKEIRDCKRMRSGKLAQMDGTDANTRESSILGPGSPVGPSPLEVWLAVPHFKAEDMIPA